MIFSGKGIFVQFCLISNTYMKDVKTVILGSRNKVTGNKVFISTDNMVVNANNSFIYSGNAKLIHLSKISIQMHKTDTMIFIDPFTTPININIYLFILKSKFICELKVNLIVERHEYLNLFRCCCSGSVIIVTNIKKIENDMTFT